MGNLQAAVAARIEAVAGVVEAESMFRSGSAYWVNGKEVAHFESEDAIEIRLTKAEIRQRRTNLKADARVTLRPSGADWITVRFDTPGDVELIAELLEIAERAHRPPPGVAAKPPPQGSDLERRRRFH